MNEKKLFAGIGSIIFVCLISQLNSVLLVAESAETWLPKSDPPADTIKVVAFQDLESAEQLALISLQGLAAREQPSIWLLVNEHDGKWLEVHKNEGHIKDTKIVTDWENLFQEYSWAYKGAVVPDEKLSHGFLHAVNMASCEDLVIASESLAEKLEIPVKVDLRGRFETNAEGYEWIWKNYKDTLGDHAACILYPGLASNGALAYDIQWRNFVFWISGNNPHELSRKGADHEKELETISSIMKELPPNMPVRGFPYAPGHLGLTENTGIAWLSRLAKAHIPSDHLANISVMSGITIESLSQAEHVSPPELRTDKIYIALTLTDGDNLNTWIDWFYKDFEHELHGEVPVGWGIGPAVLDLIPVVAEWYYHRAIPGKDEFICDVSGIGYIYPEMYAELYPHSREDIFDEYLELTERYMNRMDLRHLRTYFDTPDFNPDGYINKFFQAIPSLQAVWDGYCRRNTKYNAPYEKQTYSVEGNPVFSAAMKAAWIYGDSVDDFYRDVNEVVGDTRPAFINGALINWSFRMDKIMELYNHRSEDMVFVTPSQLTELYLKCTENMK